MRLEKKKVLISNDKKVKSFRGFKIACVCVIMKYDPLVPFVFAVRISSTSGRFKVVSVERGMGALGGPTVSLCALILHFQNITQHHKRRKDAVA